MDHDAASMKTTAASAKPTTRSNTTRTLVTNIAEHPLR
jgi:hypothetical protein